MTTEQLPDIEVFTVEDLFPYEDDGNKDRLTHMINNEDNMHIWQPGMKTEEIVSTARMTGQVVHALCGYTWVPTHNPDKYDICQQCMDIAQAIIREDG